MIVVRYHTTPSVLPVDADATIEAGMVVTVNSDGDVVPATTSTATPIGFAGDDKASAVAPTTLQNRIVDGGNETAASGMITVYHGSGHEFFLDEYVTGSHGVVDDASSSFAPGTILYTTATGGVIDNTSSGATAVAVVLAAKAKIPTGVPGENLPLGSSERYFYLVKSLI